MKTKEEILDRNGFDFEAFEYENEYSAKNLLMAMDEYATQQLEAQREKHVKTNIQILSEATGFSIEELEFKNEVQCIRPSEALEAMEAIQRTMRKRCSNLQNGQQINIGTLPIHGNQC